MKDIKLKNTENINTTLGTGTGTTKIDLLECGPVSGVGQVPRLLSYPPTVPSTTTNLLLGKASLKFDL